MLRPAMSPLMTNADTLTLWVVYEFPSDYPHHYVVRAQHVQGQRIRVDPEPHAVTSTLSAARASLPRGLFCMGRQVGDDDPAILEVWI